MNERAVRSPVDSRSLNAIVTERNDLAPGLMILRVEPDGWELSRFIPGQYTVLALPGAAHRCEEADLEKREPAPAKLIKRAYSIASSSRAKEYLEFYVTLVRSGVLTPRLFALSAGDRVWLGRKTTGVFTLDSVPTEKNLVLFSTGTGIAPYISMVRSVLAEDGNRRLAIVHGARHSWDLGYQSELMALDEARPYFHYLPIISRPQQESTRWTGETGYCQDAWTRRVIERRWGFTPTPDDTHIFLCGNPGMIEETVELLREERFREHSKRSPGQVHLEKYW
jgi:ferredoxin/flavodoxin---NADP+ reductase